MLVLGVGDRLPTVAVVQQLLNIGRSKASLLAVDGIFGAKTCAAVEEFHVSQRLPRSGVVVPKTWHALTAHARLQIRDIVDVFDPLLQDSEQNLKKFDSQPITWGGGSNAIGWIVPSISQSGVAPGKLSLLRFHGHGNKGIQVMGYGSGCHVIMDAVRHQGVPDLHHCGPNQITPTNAELAALTQAKSHSSLNLGNLDSPDVLNTLRALKPYFAPNGCVEFHGCQVGGGTDGPKFLRKVANILGVPALAAKKTQHTYNVVRFLGPIEMAFPSTKNLRSWAASLPPILASG